MTRLFGEQYAPIYDSIYSAKDYDGEVDRIERILAQNSIRPGCRILDLGCGTGGHSIRLAQRGHHVTGVDRSPEMLAQALGKREAAGLSNRLEFRQADIRQLDLQKQFDAALMMFTVLGYQQSSVDLTAALTSVRDHLVAGGIFIFDVWNGLAVSEQGPSQRTLEVDKGAERIVRRSSAKIADVERQVCEVYFDITHTDADAKTQHWQEVHALRYFFPKELPPLLSDIDMDLVDLRAFPTDGPPDSTAWTIIGTARRR